MLDVESSGCGAMLDVAQGSRFGEDFGIVVLITTNAITIKQLGNMVFGDVACWQLRAQAAGR